MNRKFSKEIKSLEIIFEFISKFIDKHKINKQLAYSINLAVEEIFTNMVKYNKESTDDISIDLEIRRHELVLSLTDFGVAPFDLTGIEEVNTDKSLEERTVGGLGLHLVRNMVDDLSYKFEKGNCVITVIKNLEN